MRFTGMDWVGLRRGVLPLQYFHHNRPRHAIRLHPVLPPSRKQMAAENITLTAEQNVTEARCTAASTTGLGFRNMQTNKPNDVGLSLYDNPVGQLAWIGGKSQTLRFSTSVFSRRTHLHPSRPGSDPHTGAEVVV
ncbi:hypothetical protein B0H14DRAFT_3529907 [Mycena olivaceomarginata]|nr:hypothetical protein B0H14DRAFT_3529907 [Mycena olivaceomarginata]